MAFDTRNAGSATAYSGGGPVFTSPANAQGAANGTLATVGVDDVTMDAYLLLTAFGFDVVEPITGIELKVYYATTVEEQPPGVTPMARLFYDGEQRGLPKVLSMIVTHGVVTTLTVGGPTDKWGWEPPSVSEIEDSPFGVELAFSGSWENTAVASWSIDAVEMKIYYGNTFRPIVMMF